MDKIDKKVSRNSMNTSNNTTPTNKKIYIQSIYESLFEKSKKISSFLLKENDIATREIWTKRIEIVLILYVIIEIVFYFLCQYYPDVFVEQGSTYKTAALAAGTILFWPLIVIYDSELFYSTYQKIKNLFNVDETDANDWYTTNAEYSFRCKGTSDFAMFINIIFIATIISLYYLLLNPDNIFLNNTIIDISYYAKIIMPIMIFISGMFAMFSKKNKNANIISFVICCGIAYYVYTLKLSSNPIPPLIDDKYIFGSLLLTVPVGTVFFVAGSAIYPMCKLINVFYLSNLEEKFIYPIEDITDFSEKIYSIKTLFLYLTIVSLVAYFQLFSIVYFLGIIRKESIITIVLFILGSFLPLIMFLATSVFFKILCRKIYIKQITQLEIDKKIKDVKLEDNTNRDIDMLSALVSLKEMYKSELETKITINSEILAAMISPIVTTILAVAFKINLL